MKWSTRLTCLPFVTIFSFWLSGNVLMPFFIVKARFGVFIPKVCLVHWMCRLIVFINCERSWGCYSKQKRCFFGRGLFLFHFPFNFHSVYAGLLHGILQVSYALLIVFILLSVSQTISVDLTSGLLIPLPAELCYWASLFNGFSFHYCTFCSGISIRFFKNPSLLMLLFCSYIIFLDLALCVSFIF